MVFTADATPAAPKALMDFLPLSCEYEGECRTRGNASKIAASKNPLDAGSRFENATG
jgi:hypothetical protein